MSRWVTNRIEPPLPPTVYDITDALDAAAKLLAGTPQLAKGNAGMWIDGQPCYCIVAAITLTSRTTAIRDEAMSAVRHAIGPRWRSIEQYNDGPRTTVSEAVTTLKQAKAYVGTVAA